MIKKIQRIGASLQWLDRGLRFSRPVTGRACQGADARSAREKKEDRPWSVLPCLYWAYQVSLAAACGEHATW